MKKIVIGIVVLLTVVSGVANAQTPLQDKMTEEETAIIDIWENKTRGELIIPMEDETVDMEFILEETVRYMSEAFEVDTMKEIGIVWQIEEPIDVLELADGSINIYEYSFEFHITRDDFEANEIDGKTLMHIIATGENVDSISEENSFAFSSMNIHEDYVGYVTEHFWNLFEEANITPDIVLDIADYFERTGNNI